MPFSNQFLRRLHFRVGLFFLALFLATGVWMALTHEAGRTNHDVRMMARSAHVYLLMSALINLLTGTFVRYVNPGLNRVVQNIGSGLLLIAPVVFLAAFLIEPAPQQLYRPISVTGVFSVALGVIFLSYGYCHGDTERKTEA